MPWVRIDEHALNHIKLLALSDGAFRLWVEGLAHCQKHLTDGAISAAALRGFRYARPARVVELTASVDGAAPLWRRADVGFEVHDYLAWNDDRETVVRKRELSDARYQRWKSRSKVASTNALETAQDARSQRTSTTTSTKDQDQNKPALKPRRASRPVENRNAADEPSPDRDAPALRDCAVGPPGGSVDRRLRVEGADKAHAVEAGLRLSEPGPDGQGARACRAGDAEGGRTAAGDAAGASGAETASTARSAVAGPEAGGVGGGRADAGRRVSGWSKLGDIKAVAS